MNNNFNNIITDYRARHDFNKNLGVLAKPTIRKELTKYFANERLKSELSKCDNVNQMINVIGQLTDELTKERTPAQLSKFDNNLARLCKLARL